MDQNSKITTQPFIEGTDIIEFLDGYYAINGAAFYYKGDEFDMCLFKARGLVVESNHHKVAKNFSEIGLPEKWFTFLKKHNQLVQEFDVKLDENYLFSGFDYRLCLLLSQIPLFFFAKSSEPILVIPYPVATDKVVFSVHYTEEIKPNFILELTDGNSLDLSTADFSKIEQILVNSNMINETCKMRYWIFFDDLFPNSSTTFLNHFTYVHLLFNIFYLDVLHCMSDQDISFDFDEFITIIKEEFYEMLIHTNKFSYKNNKTKYIAIEKIIKKLN